MDSIHSQALTSLLVMNFLEKEGVSPHLMNKLSQEVPPSQLPHISKLLLAF